MSSKEPEGTSAEPPAGCAAPSGETGTAPIHTVASIGDVVDHISVQIGPRFLELFSEHLYSSPNKAFEELVSNSWDANATAVHIGVPADLRRPDGAVWVLDNGDSMDAEGLRNLWAVATSRKRRAEPAGRRQIGKFGIGKLATYILARELTYVCRGADHVIRAVTMNYELISSADPDQLNINPIPLDVRELHEAQLDELLRDVTRDDTIHKLITQGVPVPEASADDDFGGADDFGGEDVAPRPSSGTWTLVLLTSLKPAGQEMQPGVIRRMLRAALPLGSSLKIAYNGETLESSKIDAAVAQEWKLGLAVELPSTVLIDGEERRVTACQVPYPHIRVEGFEGPITGNVRLYEDRISGGKSEAVGSSNGFFVNVLGRVINAEDPYFGLQNLNHAAWAKFRASVRADGLDALLSVNREGLAEGPALEVFRALLRSLFNLARGAHDKASEAAWPKAGEVLTKTWGSVPLEPLRRVVLDELSSVNSAPSFVDTTRVEDAEELRTAWQKAVTTGGVVEEVVLEEGSRDDPWVAYDVEHRRVVVNSAHPFAREHGETHEQQLLLRDVAFVELLCQAYMLDLGIHEDLRQQVEAYRDQLLRLLAQVRRRTALQLVDLLLAVTNDKKALEEILSDALEHLGFIVHRLAQSGEPEGVAIAPTTPGDDDEASRYSFTFDAKSSLAGKAKTGNVGVAGLVRHRKKYRADHILVVAPEYEKGALEEECATSRVTPMRAKDLATLLSLTATTGPISLTRLRDVFSFYDPDAVHDFVESLVREVRSQPRLALSDLFAALHSLGYKGPDILTTSVIAQELRRMRTDDDRPSRRDVQYLVTGLSVLVPHLVRAAGDSVFLATQPRKLRQAVLDQIRSLPEEYRFGVDDELGDPTP